MKVAVIGVGVIGNVHLEILLDQVVTPVAIFDVDESKTAKFPDEDYITYKIVTDGGASAFKTFSRATELDKQRYLNMIRARGGVEKGAPWLPTTKAPPLKIEDLD